MATKPDLVPRCDVHADRSMIKHFGTAREKVSGAVTTTVIWQCPVEGCRQTFYGGRGYYDAASTYRPGRPRRCTGHKEPMIVQAHGDGFTYVCPVDACDYTEPLAPKAAGKKGE